MIPTPIITPSFVEDLLREEPFVVVLHNDDVTPYHEVIAALIRATRCPLEEASLETEEAHFMGRADVHFAGEQECLEAADVLRRAGLKAEVRREWFD